MWFILSISFLFVALICYMCGYGKGHSRGLEYQCKHKSRFWICGWCGESREYSPNDKDYTKKVLWEMQKHDQKCEKNPLVQRLAKAQRKLAEFQDQFPYLFVT